MAAKRQRLVRDSSYMLREFHTYKNLAGSFGKLLLTVTPPQFEKFFEEIGVPIDDKSSFQPPSITPTVIGNVVKTAEKYGVEIKTSNL